MKVIKFAFFKSIKSHKSKFYLSVSNREAD